MICVLFSSERILKNTRVVQHNFFFNIIGWITDVAETVFQNVAKFFSKTSFKMNFVAYSMKQNPSNFILLHVVGSKIYRQKCCKIRLFCHGRHWNIFIRFVKNMLLLQWHEKMAPSYLQKDKRITKNQKQLSK